MNFQELKLIVTSDLHRYNVKVSTKAFFTCYAGSPGFRYTFYLRVGEYLHDKKLFRYTLYPFVKLIHRHLSFKFGIIIPIGTPIGLGLYIGHYGGIVVNGRSVIGNNCNLSQGVTIGEISFGDDAGVPVLGDNVYLAPGSKIIGGIHVGSFSVVAPNSVLHRSVEQNSVVSGIPANLISTNGSGNCIQNPFTH
jgi:serine O-acetyltransferase